MDNVEKESKFKRLAMYYLIYAFIGWIFEEVFCLITTHEFVKRGFLFGPICPMYGYGALILILCFEKFKNKPFKVFILAALVFSIFEYVTDFFLQALFAKRFWDYTGFFLNLNGRISISFSLIWGLSSVIFIKILHPFVEKVLDKILKKISIKTQKLVTNVLIALVIIDTLASSVTYAILFFT